jgi:hypothetical protein
MMPGEDNPVVALVASVMYCLLWPSVGQAQPLGRNNAMRAPLFVGAALTLTAPDYSARMRLAKDASIRGWFGEAGFPIKGRLGAGIELSSPSYATGETRGRFGESRGRQRERTVIGLAKVRVVGTSRRGVDFIGGAGALFQHHEALDASCLQPVCGRKVLVSRSWPASNTTRYGFRALAVEWRSSTRVSVGLDLRIGR